MRAVIKTRRRWHSGSWCGTVFVISGGRGKKVRWTGSVRCQTGTSRMSSVDATADISNLKIAKALFPATAGTYARPEPLTR